MSPCVEGGGATGKLELSWIQLMSENWQTHHVKEHGAVNVQKGSCISQFCWQSSSSPLDLTHIQ